MAAQWGRKFLKGAVFDLNLVKAEDLCGSQWKSETSGFPPRFHCAWHNAYITILITFFPIYPFSKRSKKDFLFGNQAKFVAPWNQEKKKKKIPEN